MPVSQDDVYGVEHLVTLDRNTASYLTLFNPLKSKRV
jgi:hypothetical protein